MKAGEGGGEEEARGSGFLKPRRVDHREVENFQGCWSFGFLGIIE